jgi:hypothetical protein
VGTRVSGLHFGPHARWGGARKQVENACYATTKHEFSGTKYLFGVIGHLEIELAELQLSMAHVLPVDELVESRHGLTLWMYLFLQ